MNDAQLPDLSAFSEPVSAPPPRPMARSRQTETEDVAVATSEHFQKPLTGPGAIPKTHLASLSDTLEQEQLDKQIKTQAKVDRHLPKVADDEPQDEPFRGSSFMSTSNLEKQIQEAQSNPAPQQAPTSPQPQANPPMQAQNSPQMPSTVARANPATRRSIQDLFTTGVLTKTIRIAGFDLRFKTVSADEYARAWALACTYPEGTARDVALRQYLLAYACTHINDSPTEDQCSKKDITDPVARRAEVFARLDNELVRRFFDNGYVPVRQQSVELLEKLDQEAVETANFTQATR